MASSQIEDFNWNLRHFLDVMANYQANVNKANPATLQLLEQTLDKLGNLLENVGETEEGRNETIIFGIDERTFDIKRSIFCRMCGVDFGATRTEYILHLADEEHNRKLIDYMNKADTNNNKQVGSCEDLTIGAKPLSKDSDQVPIEPTDSSSATKFDRNPRTNGAAVAAANDQERDPSEVLQQQHQTLDVFGDDIFEFLDSRNNSGNEAKHLNKPNVKNALNNGHEKTRELETGAIPKHSWRNSSNGNNQTAHTEQWRQKTNTDRTNHNATKNSNAQDAIRNAAVYSGTGIRPCPTFELNNMYLKFPHLNSEKVPNPLKPAQTHRARINGPTNGAGDSSSRQRNSSSSSSAATLNKNSLAHRGRSLSSIDMTTGAAKAAADSSQRKNDHKFPAQQKTQSNDVKNSGGGAIPKQPNRYGVQSNNTKLPNSLNEVSDSLIDVPKLEKFFSNDLSMLINLIVTVNSRSEKIVTQKKLIESIENLLRPTFATAKGYLMGSHAYKIAKGGLATVDIHLDLQNSFHTDKAGQIFIDGMNKARQLLERSDEWTNVECSEQTRYAILSAEHIGSDPERKKCHFTFGTGVAVKNTEIINTLFAAQPVAQQVVICVRLALQEGAKGEWTSHFGGYVITLLVIFYLQIEKKLPSVLSLQKGVTPVIKCGENLVQFKSASVAICKDRVRDLLIGFFNYYQNFDFTNKIISTFEGCEIQMNFRNKDPNSMSNSIHRFRNLIETEPKRWTSNHMYVQDTFEHKRNVTHKVKGNHIKAFKDFCAKSHAIIQAVGPTVKY